MGVAVNLPDGKFGAILADPPWAFQSWSGPTLPSRAGADHYQTMSMADIQAMPVADLAADDCVLFLWVTWPTLMAANDVINAWGFTYKTCAFCWTKADLRQGEMFEVNAKADMLLGHWTRANSEVCLLATRGKPKRLDAGVRQAIIERRREHSRKPDGIHGLIERLVAGPYLELFARAPHRGWTVWGNETQKFAEAC